MTQPIVRTDPLSFFRRRAGKPIMAPSVDRNSRHEDIGHLGPSEVPTQLPLSPVSPPLIDPEVPIYRYLELSHNGDEVFIDYEGKRYRLRTTKNGKLILNK